MAKNGYDTWSNADLIAEIEALKKRKKFGLVWEDKPEKVVTDCETKLPVLEEVKTLAINTDEDKPTNLLIQGDNYHALSVLNYTHQGKIDVIYIDPPYNTGKKDFKYNDYFVEEEDGFRHSKWLSFMEKRLKLARNLLTDNGVIFVSIDDNEQANLKLLMDEIFGEKNVDCFIWQKTGDGRWGKMKNTTTFRKDHEYVIVAFKSVRYLNKLWDYPDFKNDGSNPDNDSRGKYISGIIARLERASNLNHKNYFTVVSPTGKEHSRQFEITEKAFNELNADGRIYWGKNGDAFPSVKIFLNERRFSTPPSVLKKGTTYDGTKELSVILPDVDAVAMRPKPTALLTCLVQLASKKDSIILDFFAGSGTTGHAVSLLNKEDGGKRQFILCTNNENGIAREVCYPRIKAVIEGNDKLPEITKIPFNLRYYKTAFVDSCKVPTDQDKARLTQKSAKMICVKEGTFAVVKDLKTYKIFRNKDRYTAIIYNESAIDNFKKCAAKINGKIAAYIFSLGDDDYADEFADMRDKIRVCAIPEAILRVYRQIFNKKGFRK